MFSKFAIRSLLFVFVASILISTPNQAFAGEDESIPELATKVRKMDLGEESFYIGAYLTEEQITTAQENLLDDAFPGTIKFAAGDVAVVADEKTHLVLAVFRHIEEATMENVKQIVGHLMTSFGVPTTMAHGNLVYWAFGPEGKIDEQTYNEAKSLGVIDILATVKLSSDLPLSPEMADPESEETGVIYYIITSDPLLDRFVKKN